MGQAADEEAVPFPTDDVVDDIQEGYYGGRQFLSSARRTMVIADGGMLSVMQDVAKVDVAKLRHFLIHDPDGPQVPARTEAGLTNLGWHWVDSIGAIKDDDIRQAFETHEYADVQGRQSTQADAKVQSLIRQFFFYDRSAWKRVTQATIVILAGDGDHALNFRAGIEALVAKRKLNVSAWIVSWDKVSLSSKWQTPELRSLCTVHVRYVASHFTSPNETNRSGTLTLPVVEPNLKQFVEEVFPKYSTFPRLLRSSGLQKFLTSVWKGAGKVYVINGHTGCGKSTQIPQLLYDLLSFKRWSSSPTRRFAKPRILITQPRRLACTELAQRVKHEREARKMKWDEDRTIGSKFVGYHIGQMKCSNEESSLVYSTAGVLERQLLNNRDVECDVAVLDEFHERSSEYEIILSLLLNPEFLTPNRTVVIMSATLSDLAEKLRAYICRRISRLETQNESWYTDPSWLQTFDIGASNEEGCDCDAAFVGYEPLYDRPKFKVDEYFIRDAMDLSGSTNPHILKPPANNQQRVIWRERTRFVENFVRFLVRRAFQEKKKEVLLVFLPGFEMMRDIEVMLRDSELGGIPHIGMLHSMVGLEGQQATLRREENVRVILATSVAESSLTIEDATIVIDMCLQKEESGSEGAVKTLDYARAPKDSCMQRKGRVGRVADGVYYRMVTRQEWELMPASRRPGILVGPLYEQLLRVFNIVAASASRHDPLRLLQNCLDQPPGVDAAVQLLLREQLLEQVGARLRLLPMGCILNRLPVPLALGKFIVWASLVEPKLGVLATEIAAVVSTSEVGQSNNDDGVAALRQLQDQALRRLAQSEGFLSDIVVCLNMLRAHRSSAVKEYRGTWAYQPMTARAGHHVEEKISKIRRELHRFRPLLPALPDELMMQRSASLTTKDVIRAIRGEGHEFTHADIVCLILIHSGAMTNQRLDACCEPSREAPFSTMLGDVSVEPNDASRVAPRVRTRIKQVFESRLHNGLFNGAVSFVPGRSCTWFTFKVELPELAREKKLSAFPVGLYMAAQLDRCYKATFMTKGLRKFKLEAGRFCKISDPACPDHHVVVDKSSCFRPLILPAGCTAAAVYPSTIVDHQQQQDPSKYTRICGFVSVLPDSFSAAPYRSGDGRGTLSDLVELLFSGCDVPEGYPRHVRATAALLKRRLVEHEAMNLSFLADEEGLYDDADDLDTLLLPPRCAAGIDLRGKLEETVRQFMQCTTFSEVVDTFRPFRVVRPPAGENLEEQAS